jgi:photosystem II stability/assembly factor-like uncharacterized protein
MHAATAGALLFLAAPAAVANGRFPASNQIAFSPTDPNLVVLRTTYGILLSHDGGDSWRWLCEDVLGISSSSSQDPVLGLVANGGIVAAPGSIDGLVVSPDTGCNWNRAPDPLRSQLIKDLAVRPDAPDVILALTSTLGPDAGAEGGPGYAQQVYESTDDGADWSVLGSPIDPSALATTIDVAAADSHRLYVSATRGGVTTSSASLFVSYDDGDHWTERAIPLAQGLESSAFIAAIDPVRADRVYIRTAGASSRLLVTDDAGQTYSAPFSLNGQMLGFALSPDGSTVYAGNIEQGLFFATSDALSFQKLSAVHVQCLGTHGSDLWVCSDEPTGFIAGVARDGDAVFTPKLHLLAQPLVACAADSGAVAQCGGAPAQALCQLLPGCDTDGGGDAGPMTAGTPAARSGGCAVGGKEGWATTLALAFASTAFAALLGARRRARGPRGRRGAG